MKPRHSFAFLARLCLLALALIVGMDDAGSQEPETVSIVRGPYLQLGTPTSIIVRWRTNVATDSRVAYGTSASAQSLVAYGGATTTEHEVLLPELAPDTRYFYSVGSLGRTLATGADCTFVTAPPVGTDHPTRVWVLGDSGTKDAIAAGVRNGYTSFANGRHTDVWLMLGDNAYNSGTDAEYQAAVFNMYPSYLRQTPLWSTIGNHDTAGSVDPLPTIPHFKIFTKPTAGEAGGVPSGTEKYYSFDYGRIHFICLDSMTSSRFAGSPMLTWLENDLASTTQDWIVAFFHHPPYTKGSHDSDLETDLIQMRENVLPVLEAGGVDLVLAGHSHNYERSFLIDGHYGHSRTFSAQHVKDGRSGREGDDGAYVKPPDLAANQGAVYVVAGNGGHVTRWADGSTAEYPARPHVIMHYSALHVGSLVLDVSGNRLDARMIRETGAIDDYFSIVKEVRNELPTVAITGPEEGGAFGAGASVTVVADAADLDGTIAQVDFRAGERVLGTATAAPWTVTWHRAAGGSHALTATATDNLGATVESARVNIFVESSVPPIAPDGLVARAGTGPVAVSRAGRTGLVRYSVRRPQVDLRWADNSADESAFYVESSTDGINFQEAAVLAPNVRTLVVSNLLPKRRYYFRVRALNALGDSEWSNPVGVTTRK